MNVHSSKLQTPTIEAPKHSPNPRAGAAEQQSGDASFAKHLDADHVPPAQAARAALESRPDLADRPFGAIVSLFARHEELPAAADASSTEPTTPTEPTPTEPVPTDDGAAEADDGGTSSAASA
jgi:hypothetical protein